MTVTCRKLFDLGDRLSQQSEQFILMPAAQCERSTVGHFYFVVAIEHWMKLLYSFHIDQNRTIHLNEHLRVDL